MQDIDSSQEIREKVAFKVTPPTKSIVQVSENSVDAGGEYEAIAVTYTVQDYVYKQNNISSLRYH